MGRYRPINGDTWKARRDGWVDEWYGVLEQDYATVRRPAQLADLQRIQRLDGRS